MDGDILSFLKNERYAKKSILESQQNTLFLTVKCGMLYDEMDSESAVLRKFIQTINIS